MSALQTDKCLNCKQQSNSIRFKMCKMCKMCNECWRCFQGCARFPENCSPSQKKNIIDYMDLDPSNPWAEYDKITWFTILSHKMNLQDLALMVEMVDSTKSTRVLKTFTGKTKMDVSTLEDKLKKDPSLVSNSQFVFDTLKEPYPGELYLILLKHGLDVNLWKDKTQYTLLHHFVNSKYPDMVELLLRGGAYYDIVNQDGNRPIDDAQDALQYGALRYLQIVHLNPDWLVSSETNQTVVKHNLSKNELFIEVDESNFDRFSHKEKLIYSNFCNDQVETT